MIKVVFVGFDINGIGGISTYSRGQIQSLRRHGFDVYTINLNTQQGHHSNRESSYSDTNIKWNKLSGPLLLLAHLYRRQASLILFNHVNLTPVGLLLNLVKKSIYSFSGYNNDVLKDFNVIQKNAIKRSFFSFIDCEFTIGRLDKRLFKNPVLLYDPVELVQPKTINSEGFKSQFNIPENAIIISTVALMRLSANKGHELILRAMAKVSRDDLYYIIVGDGPDRARLEQVAQDLGISRFVIFTGFVSEEMRELIYQNSDVMGLVSKFCKGVGEGVPLGLLEGMKYGKAILASKEDGSAEAFNDTFSNGYCVSPDVESVAEALVCMNRDTLERMGINSKILMNERFSIVEFDNILKQTILNATT